MKKNFIYQGLMIITALAFTNCAKQEEIASQKEDAALTGIHYELNVSAVTKTSFDGTSNKIEWSEGDALNVFVYDAGTETLGNATNYKFSLKEGETDVFETDNGPALTEGNDYDWYALYPYSSFVKSPANTSTGYLYIGSSGANVAQEQEGNNSMAHLAGQYFPLFGSAKTVGADETPSMTLNPALAIIRVCVTNGLDEDLTVESVQLKAAEDIVGSYYINFSGDAPSFVKSGNSYVSSTAKLIVNNGGAIPKGDFANFFLGIKPFTAKAGDALTLKVNDSEKTITLTSDITFSAGLIKTLKYRVTPSAPIAKKTYVKVTSTAEITDGEYLIVNENAGVAFDGSLETLDSVGNVVDVDIDENGKIALEEGHNFTISVAAGTVQSASGKYIGVSSNSNGLAQTDDASTYSHSFEIDGENAIIKSVFSGSIMTLRYNNVSNQNRFRYYKSGQQAVQLYKLEDNRDAAPISWSGTEGLADITGSGIDYELPSLSNLENLEISYSSSNPEVATISDAGVVEALTVGTTVISAIYTATSVSTYKTTVVSYNLEVTDSRPTVEAPTFSPAAGEVDAETEVTISCATDGATIYYTTGTSDFSDGDWTQGNSVTISEAITLKAIAVKDGYKDSAVATASYTIAGGVADYKYTFTAKNWSATLAGNAANWNSGKDGAGFSNNGIQVTTNATGANGTSKESFTSVSKVVVTYNTNKSGGAGSLDLNIGNNTAHSANWSYTGSGDGRVANYTCTFNIDTPESGKVKLTVNTKTNSIYVVSVTVTAAGIE